MADKPFIEGENATFTEHAGGAVQRATIDARWRVHVARFDDIYRRRDARGAEAGSERWHEVTRPVIVHQLTT